MEMLLTISMKETDRVVRFEPKVGQIDPPPHMGQIQDFFKNQILVKMY